MKITTTREDIKAGWFTFTIRNEADVQEYNNSIERVVMECHIAAEFEWPRYDDDHELPNLRIEGRDGDTVLVSLRGHGLDVLDTATLPTVVHIWSFDRQAASLERVDH